VETNNIIATIFDALCWLSETTPVDQFPRVPTSSLLVYILGTNNANSTPSYLLLILDQFFSMKFIVAFALHDGNSSVRSRLPGPLLHLRSNIKVSFLQNVSLVWCRSFPLSEPPRLAECLSTFSSGSAALAPTADGADVVRRRNRRLGQRFLGGTHL
jgi:hypothetical protein